MSLDDAFRTFVGEALRAVVREELRAALAEARPAATGEDGYLSVQKAATIADVHADTIRAWVKTGRLPEHRAGRELRVRRDELRRFLEGGGEANGHRLTPEEEAAAILSRRRT